MYFTLSTAHPSSVALDNRNTACVSWTVAYVSDTFAALSLEVDAATGITAPGAFAIFPGAVLSGVNPNVAITQASTTMFGYMPWMQVNATVPGREQSRGGCTVQANVHDAAGQRRCITVTSSGYLGCDKSLPFTLAGAGNTQIIPLVLGQVIQVCHIDLATNPAESVYLTYGTGMNCAGVSRRSRAYGRTFLPWRSIWPVRSSCRRANALCVNQGAAQAAGGLVTYSQHP